MYEITGVIENTNLTTTYSLRVSDVEVDGVNIALKWTGSRLPGGIASFSSDNILAVNDGINDGSTSTDARWSNWTSDGSRTSDWIGIMFGDAGDTTKRYIDNFDVTYYVDSGLGLPEEYDIEYYIGEFPQEPEIMGEVEKDVNHPFNNPDNWVSVTNLEGKDSIDEKNNAHYIFDGVETYAVRLKFNKPTGKPGIGINEIEIYDRETVSFDEIDATVTIDGVLLEEFDPEVLTYTVDRRVNSDPVFEITTENNTSFTIMPDLSAEDTYKVVMVSEDGIVIKEYKFKFTYELHDALSELSALIETARAIDLEDYTGDSSAKLIKAIEEALAGLENEELTLEEIVELTEKLQAAIDGLKVAESIPIIPLEPSKPIDENIPATPLEPSKPGGDNKPTNPKDPNGEWGSQVPPTGLSYNSALYVSLLGLGLVLITVLKLKKRKQDIAK